MGRLQSYLRSRPERVDEVSTLLSYLRKNKKLAGKMSHRGRFSDSGSQAVWGFWCFPLVLQDNEQLIERVSMFASYVEIGWQIASSMHFSMGSTKGLIAPGEPLSVPCFCQYMRPMILQDGGNY